jgi:hypothetical protein
MTMKPGYKTTEFYFAAAAKLLGILFASGIIASGSTADRIAGLAVAALATLGYTVSRTLVKSATPGGEIKELVSGQLLNTMDAKVGS